MIELIIAMMTTKVVDGPGEVGPLERRSLSRNRNDEPLYGSFSNYQMYCIWFEASISQKMLRSVTQNEIYWKKRPTTNW